MTCLNRNKRDTEILLDYCAGTLDAERAVALENHARECAECRALIAAQKNLWSALGELDAPEVSPEFDARLYARIAQENAEPAWRVWWNRLSLGGLSPIGFSWKPLLAGVAASAVVGVGLLVYAPMLHMPGAPDAARQIRTDPVDVEQLEVTLQDLEMLTPPSASVGKTPAGKM